MVVDLKFPLFRQETYRIFHLATNNVRRKFILGTCRVLAGNNRMFRLWWTLTCPWKTRSNPPWGNRSPIVANVNVSFWILCTRILVFSFCHYLHNASRQKFLSNNLRLLKETPIIECGRNVKWSEKIFTNCITKTNVLTDLPCFTIIGPDKSNRIASISRNGVLDPDEIHVLHRSTSANILAVLEVGRPLSIGARLLVWCIHRQRFSRQVS